MKHRVDNGAPNGIIQLGFFWHVNELCGAMGGTHSPIVSERGWKQKGGCHRSGGGVYVQISSCESGGGK